MDNKKYIVCMDTAGLGNRMKCLASLWRISEKLSLPLLLYWPRHHVCDCEFQDLFSNEFKQITKEELEEIKQKEQYRLYRDVFEKPSEDINYFIFKTWKFVFLPDEIPKGFSEVFSSKEGKNVDFEFERIPEDIKNSLLEYIRKLKPIPKIQNQIDDFLKSYDLHNYVGVHLRRGDNRFTVDGREKVSSDEKFIKRMEEILKQNPETKFFICTDSEETLDRFIYYFGEEKIVSYQKETFRRTSIGVQEALVEIMLLSKTKHILGSYLSTFSELAWWLGNCKAKMEIVGQEDVEESLKPKSRIIRKIKFYKVIFLRWLFRVYK